MEIIIKIPKEIYTGEQTTGILPIVVDAIGKGIPLPEHHGRLIDADYLVDNLDKYIQVARYYDKEDNLITHIITKIDDVPTIIEADKGEVKRVIEGSDSE